MSYMSLLTFTPVLLEPVIDKSVWGPDLYSSLSLVATDSFEMGSTLGKSKPKEEASGLVIDIRPQKDDNRVDSTSASKPVQFDPLSCVPTHLDRNCLDFPFFTDRATFAYLSCSDSKVMFIMRGLSGSGKSTVVSIIKSSFKNVVVCSADDYFFTPDGEYKFDEKLLSSAHGDCQQRAKLACKNKVPVVVIDNTNVRKWEMKFYADLANSSGYVAVTVEPKTSWKWDAEQLAARNKHGVTAEVLQRKVNMFDDVIPLYYGWFLNERKSKCLTNFCSQLFAECLSKFPGFKRDLLKQLGISAEHTDEETAFGILSDYYSQQGKSSPLLHSTSMFCARGKVPKSNDYHRRPDVQKSCGQMFTLLVTGLVISKKTMGARLTLSASALSLFNRPEEKEWKPHFLNGKLSAHSRENDVPEEGLNHVGKKKGKKGTKSQKKKKGRGKVSSEETNGTNGDHPSNRGASSSPHSSGNFVDELYADAADSISDLSLSEMPNNDTLLSKMFPSLNNSGFARSAHLTIMTARGVESREVNFDILQACDVEAALGSDMCTLVPVQRGQACYYGNGLCCVYFDKPLHVKTLFSGYY